MKINKDLIIENTSKTLETLNNEVETLKPKVNETVLWTGNTKISTSNNGILTLSNMPNLTNYTGKILKLHINYGGDAEYVSTYYLNDTCMQIFVPLVRDFSGQNDMWHILFCFYDLKTTNWKVKTNLSYVVKNATISVADSANYRWQLRKVSILDV